MAGMPHRVLMLRTAEIVPQEVTTRQGRARSRLADVLNGSSRNRGLFLDTLEQSRV